MKRIQNTPILKNVDSARLVVLILTILVINTTLSAQGWRVKQFSSTLELQEDGSFDVTEDITVDFSESKRGIIRKLPYRYSQSTAVTGEVAAGHQTGMDYLTPITGIEVENWNFALTKAANDYEIKIGKADEYLTGEQRYRIHYKVYGGINHFKKSQELYWNVNGNDWDVEFDNIDVTILLPTAYKLAAADVGAFTGTIGSTSNTSEAILEPGKVKVVGTRRFGPHEGLTVVLRLPQGYVKNDPIPLEARADNCLIDSIKTSMTLLDGGMIDVEERLVITVFHPDHDFVRTLEKTYRGTDGPNSQAGIIHYEVLDCWSKQAGYDQQEVYESISGYDRTASDYTITIPGTIFPKVGTYVLRLHYTVWAGTVSGESESAAYLPWLNPNVHEPIAYARVDLRWPEGQVSNLENVLLSATVPQDGKILLESKQLRLEFTKPLEIGQQVHFGMLFPGRKSKVTPTPLHVFEPLEYFQFYEVDLDIQPSGRVHVVNRFGTYRYSWYERVSRPITLEYEDWRPRKYEPGQPQFWGTKGKYLVQNMKGEGEVTGDPVYSDHALQLWGPKMLKYAGIDTLEYSYDIFGVLRQEGDRAVLDFPLIETTTHATDRIHFRIHYPGDKVLTMKDIAVVSSINAETIPQNALLTFKPGEITGDMPQGMTSYQELLVKLQLPEGAVTGSFWANLHLLWINHKSIFLPLFFLIPLLIAWFIAGRDKRFTMVVEFYPPEDLTPTEAGLLIDDKLHNRDLLALIYYWGAQGYITIREIYDKEGKPKDYEFTRLKKLPSSARKYERTIFNALFASGAQTKVSAHKQQFYSYLAKARTEVETHAKSKNFYVPGTRGWAIWLKVLAWIVTVVAVILAGMVIFDYSLWMRGRWEIPLGWGLSAFLLFFFARVMPRKAPFGQQQYQKLIGFREFVMRAEKDKLQELVDTNPAYFGMTLPYAIALGIATKWVDQFGDLLTMPPTYYKSDQSVSNFQLAQFNRMLQLQLDQMSDSFNSTPPSSSSGGSYSSSSGGSSYSSSSSYSSRSSSGGSGFSSGGGYSGGGYGGGGGSAW